MKIAFERLLLLTKAKVNAVEKYSSLIKTSVESDDDIEY
jgi:hypothetical protein